MTVIALVSGKGSPGVTTTALATLATWPVHEPGTPPSARTAEGAGPGQTPSSGGGEPARVLLVDADPAGCGVGPGFLRGAAPEEGGLIGLALGGGAPLTGDVVLGRALALDETGLRLLLPGISEFTQTAAMAPAWPDVANALASLSAAGADVLVDTGRLGTAGAPGPLLDGADLVVVVARSSLASVTGARSAVRQLEQSAARTGRPPRTTVVVVGSGRPYPESEIARSLGVPVTGTVAWDPVSAAVLSDGAPAGWRYPRSMLLRSARVLAARLHETANGARPPALAAGSAPGPVTDRVGDHGAREMRVAAARTAEGGGGNAEGAAG